MNKFEIFKRTIIRNNAIYEFIVEEIHFKNVKRTKKMYSINKNGECILHTSLWQTWKKKQREIEGV